MCKKLLLLIFIIFPLKIYSQNEPKVQKYVNPMLFVGYAFGSGFVYGIDITFGILELQQIEKPMRLAVSSKYYFIDLNGYANRVLNFSMILENEYSRFGIGVGEIKRKWGFKKRNINRTFGPTVDFGLHFYENTYIPWLGFYGILPLKNSEWFERNYSAGFYTYFRQSNIKL